MTKNQFIQVLHNYSDTSQEDVEKVLALKESYPYSQVLHALAARLCKDHGFSNQKTELQQAAVYASDRAVLKDVMSRAVAVWPVSHEVAGMKHPVTPESIAVATATSTADEGDVAEEVIHDLERLKELKHNFELMFIEEDGSTIVKQPVPTESASEKKKEPDGQMASTDTTDSKPKPPKKKKKSGKSKAERIVELAKQLEETGSANEDQTEDEEEVQEPSDNIIREIKSKKKLDPETEKQREQINLIDQFIRTQPRISNTKDKPININQGDLSTIKSGEFGDNVISETLVDILLKQGKKDKAVEVLKKLIWKFPQKKAYFAAQIEDLKK